MPLGIPKVRNPYYNPHPDENKDGTDYSDPEAPSASERGKLPYTEPDPLYLPKRRRSPSTKPYPYYPLRPSDPDPERRPNSYPDPERGPNRKSEPERGPNSYPDPERGPNRKSEPERGPNKKSEPELGSGIKSELGTGPFPVQNSGLPELPGFASNPPNLVLNPEIQWVDI